MHLYLIRHGQSHVNLGGWEHLPTMDAGLTEKGQKQAEALRDWLKAEGATADVLYCSTMRRAVETATYVSDALNLQAIPDDRIREIGSNYATGSPIDEDDLPRSFVGQRANVRPFLAVADEMDGSESWSHFRVRLATFIDFIANRHFQKTVYVVAHGGVIAGIFDNLFNVGPYRRCDVHSYNTSWAHFEFKIEHEPWYLRAHNRIDHLVGKDLL